MIARPIFIGGMPRSGTTLLRVMLDSHPHIACGPELRVIPALAGFSAQLRTLYGETLRDHYKVMEDDFNSVFHDLATAFIAPYARRRKKARIAEKTPANVLHFDELSQLFPDCRCIHVIRDGRDVVASLLQMDWSDARSGVRLDINRNASSAAAAWVLHVRRGRDAMRAGKPVHEVRYEHLINEPKKTLHRLLAFLAEPWSEEVLAHHYNPTIWSGVEESSAHQVAKPLYSNSIGRWRRALSPQAKDEIRRHAGDLLIELGYDDGGDW